MIELNEMIEATAPLVVECNGFTVNCEVRLNAITGEFIESLKDLSDLDAGYKIAEKSLGKWDIAVDKKVLPINSENLRKVPTTFVENFLDAVKAERASLKKQK